MAGACLLLYALTSSISLCFSSQLYRLTDMVEYFLATLVFGTPVFSKAMISSLC